MLHACVAGVLDCLNVSGVLFVALVYLLLLGIVVGYGYVCYLFRFGLIARMIGGWLC